MYAGQVLPNQPLESMNLATGAATPIGPGVGTGISLGALAFDSLTNTLFGLDDAELGGSSLYTINPITGVATFVTDGLDADNSGMTYDPVLNRLWNIDAQGRLSFFDPAAGFAQTEVTIYDGLFDGLAYVAPEPGTWVLLLAGFAALGVRARRRRR